LRQLGWQEFNKEISGAVIFFFTIFSTERYERIHNYYIKLYAWLLTAAVDH